MDRLFYILVAAVEYGPDRAARMARSGVLRIFARGWLIERARTRRLRAQLDEARREAEAMRDRFIDSEQDRDDTAGRYTEFGLPWEASDATPYHRGEIRPMP